MAEMQSTASEDSGITLKQWLPLIGLACAAFVFNMSEFMPVGLLTDIAATFSLTEAEAGIMISVYAWGVMILSMPLMVFATRFDFKRMLLAVVAVFSLGQFLSAIAPVYPFLVCARLVVASAHAVFWSVATIMATRLVEEKYAPVAISIIATGSSIAMIFGLPVGRTIGLLVGWRMTFALVGAISAVVVVYQFFVFPEMSAGEPFGLKQVPGLFKRPFLVALYLVTIFITIGYYAGYSYIEPFMQQVGSFDAQLITLALAVFGVAGLLGSWLFGRFFDGHQRLFLGTALVSVVAALLLIRPASVSIPTMFATCLLWGTASTCFSVSFQSEVINRTPLDASAVAMSIYSGLFNLGIGTGTAIGGQVVNILGIEMIGFVGAAFAAVGVVLTFVMLFPTMKPTQEV